MSALNVLKAANALVLAEQAYKASKTRALVGYALAPGHYSVANTKARKQAKENYRLAIIAVERAMGEMEAV
jgi:hypothetical protein